MSLDRKKFDISKVLDYTRYDFEGSNIIDFIVNVDGSKDEIYNTNYIYFKNFIDYLKTKDFKNEYIYISTLSTLDENINKDNIYVYSKYMAEAYLRSNIENYKIIRLSFPFAYGENKNRLVSRLINKIKNKEKLIVDKVKLILTPINFLKKNFMKSLNSKNKEINLHSEEYYELKDLVDLIMDILSIRYEYSYNSDKSLDFTYNLAKKRGNIQNLRTKIEQMV